MSLLPPSPFLESVAPLVALTSATDDPAAAQQPPVRAAAGDPLSASGAEGTSAVQCGGRLIPESQSAGPRRYVVIDRSRLAAHTFEFQSSDGGIQPDVRCREHASEASEKALPSETFRAPAGYVLVERELLGRVVKRLRQAAVREREQLRGTPWAFLLRGAE